MQPVLSIIIVNWNTRSDLDLCLSSIKEALPSGFAETIVVDNASQDDSVYFVRREFPDIILIENSSNSGFAAGVNAGIRRSRGEFLLVMNPDIILGAGVVETLISFLRANANAGAVMPLLRNLDGSEQEGYVRRIPTIRQVLWFYTALYLFGLRDRELVAEVLMTSPKHGDSPIEVPQIPGAFLLTRKATVSEVGLWDNAYKLFFEDVDWCDRVLASGKKLVMLPWIEAIHAGGRSVKTVGEEWFTARMAVSLVTFFWKRRSMWQAFVAATALGANAFLGVLKNCVQFVFCKSRQESATKIMKFWNVIRLMIRAFVFKNDHQVIPTK